MLYEKSRYAVELNRLVLTPLGIWPIGKDAHPIHRLLKRLAVVVCYLLMSCLFVPTIQTFVESEPAVKLKLTGPMSFHFMSVVKYLSLVGKSKQFSACFEHVEQDWKTYSEKNGKLELDIMRHSAKIGRYLIYCCTAFMFGGGFFYHAIMPVSASVMVTKQLRAERYSRLSAENSSTDFVDVEPVLILAYPTYGPLSRLDYVPTLLLQFVAGFVLYTITVASCSLAAVFANHVCGQLEIVVLLLRNFICDDENDEIFAVHNWSRSEKLSEIVERHLRALDFASEIEDHLNAICFAECIGCTFNICFLGFYFVTDWENRNTVSTMTHCILLMSFMTNIFVFCFIGALLTEQSEKIGDVAYAIDWYKLPSKKAKDMVMIIQLASCYPAKLTAGKIVNLSFGSFCNVIKTSATYFNLLRTLT